jgi:hydroxymethylglutaryl-CoA reductase (NADPH)
MGCYGSGKVNRFAELIAATVLAGEFPTAAAVVNKTYIQAHNRYGRNKPSSE